VSNCVCLRNLNTEEAKAQTWAVVPLDFKGLIILQSSMFDLNIFCCEVSELKRIQAMSLSTF
jgi:hypothetical protein